MTTLRIASIVLTVLLSMWLVFRVLESLSIYVFFNNPSRKGDLSRFLCDECGYDLRGSPERCPECGAKLPPMKATFVRYLMRIDKLDDLERRRRARGERQ